MAEPDRWQIARLTRRHDRSAFDCGEPALDEFLRRFARQNDEKNLSRTYVATRPGSAVVAGYYSIRTGSVAFDLLTDAEKRGLPRYPIPVLHLARLAVDRSSRGLGLGETLLMHALDNAVRVAEHVGLRAVEVVAKNDAARAFYARYGFHSLHDDVHHMYLSLAAIEAAFARG